MTRFEKFQNMDIDKFTDYFMGTICGCIDDCPALDLSCHECIKVYLKEEVEE